MKKVEIYTDGSSRGNPGPGGYGTVIQYGPHRKELSAGFRKTTNNRMEILAAVAGLEALTQSCAVTIHSDSKYLVNAMSKGWLRAWKSRGWVKKDKQPVKNVDLWERLVRASNGHEVEWRWVKGHAGHKENERCDALATAAAGGRGLAEDAGFEAN